MRILRVSILTITFGLFGLMFLGCASDVKKADIPTTADPQLEITKLDVDIQGATTKNIDVLAASEFKASIKYWNKAKDSIKESDGQEDALEALRMGRGYLEKAYALSENRESKAAGLFAARQLALAAGADKYPELREDWKSLDSDVSSKADDLAQTSTDKISDFQKRYVDLERRAVVLRELGKSQAILNGAQKDGAPKTAPVSFKNADLSLKTAQSMISTNVRNPNGYRAAVLNANKDAAQLMNVLSVIKSNGQDLAEPVAIKIVAQNKKIFGLTNDLSFVTAQGEAVESTLQSKNEELNSAQNRVQIQKALERARVQFTAAEAEAYQQGQTLVIRLKQVNFASGRSDLPVNSLPLLAKVSDVARTLDASQITIEGHTDSLGTAAENKTISKKRADAVASYLKTNGFSEVNIEAEGFGFYKPIASNKSKEGRAQNRRVDIIITPHANVQ